MLISMAQGYAEGLTEREAEIYRLTVVNRLTQGAIGKQMGITQQAVSTHLAHARAKLPAPDLEAIRAEALALHEDVIRRSLELAELEGAPVTSGKDGAVVYDPQSGAVVRDYGGRINALRLALAADAERRKLMGADSATKTEVSGQVQYRIVGVDLDELK
jgi:DNA-binding CsgD family transcriptional regulator